MIFIKKLFLLLLAAMLLIALTLSLSACTAAPAATTDPPPEVTPEAAPAPPQAAPEIEEAEWTIAIYLCGTDLESNPEQSFGTRAFIEMLTPDIPDDINLIVMTGGTKEWNPAGYAEEAVAQGLIASDAYIKPDVNQTQIFRIAGKKMELLYEYGENLNMGDTQTFTGFMRYVLEEYPSRRLMTIVNNHGFGPIEGIAADEYTQQAMLLPDLAAAFDEITTLRGKPVDLIGFDACNMGNLEIAYMLSPYADYMVASSDLQEKSWQYEMWLDSLSRDPAMETPELGRAIIDTYAYKQRPDGDWSKLIGGDTLLLLDLCDNKMSKMMDAFNAMATELYKLQQRPDERLYAFRAANMAQKTAHPELVDIYDFTKLVYEYGKLSSAEAVFSALGTPPGEAPENFIGDVAGDGIVLYRGVGAHHNRSIALSFWFPAYTSLSQSHDELMSEFEVYRALGVSTAFNDYLEVMLDFKYGERPFTGDLEDLENTETGDFILYTNDPFAIEKLSNTITKTTNSRAGDKTYLLGEKEAVYNWREGRFDTTVLEGSWIALDGKLCTARIDILKIGVGSIAEYIVHVPAYIDGDHDNIGEVILVFMYTSDPQIAKEYPARGTIENISVSGDMIIGPGMAGKSIETLLIEVDPVTNEPTGNYIVNEPFVIGEPDEIGNFLGYVSLEPLPDGQNFKYRYNFELTDKKGNVFTMEKRFTIE